jgi:hypothetical protein
MTGFLRGTATQFDRAALTRQAMAWLHSHGWVLPGQSRIDGRVAAAQSHVTKGIREEMVQGVGRQTIECWVQHFSADHDEESDETVFEWLRKRTAGTSQTNIAKVVRRLDALRDLGADKLSLARLPIAGVRHYARIVATQKAQSLAKLRDPRRTVEIVAGCACIFSS